MTADSSTSKNGREPSTTQQAGFSRAVSGKASPRRTGLSNCSICDTNFTIFEHRHTCRKCQEPVCHRCSRSRKVFRAGTKSERVCDDCVQTFPSATKIVADNSKTIESVNRSRLTLPASDAANTCAERSMLSPRLSQDEEVVRNEVAVEATDRSQAEETNNTGTVNGAELKAAEIDVSITATVDILAGAIPSTDMPAFAAPELSPEEASDTSGTVQTNAVDGTLLPAELEVALPAPEEHPTEKDAETAAANSTSTWTKKSGARLERRNVAVKIYGWGLAAVFMGLEVGLCLLERD